MLCQADANTIFTHDFWIFQSEVPGPLAADWDAVKGPNGPPPHPFTFALASGPVTRQTKGGMREMHWHPNADEWRYYVKGSAQMTVFNTGPKAVTNNFTAGDIGYVKRNFGHYVRNTGDVDLMFLKIFKSGAYQDILLSDWLARTSPALVAAHFNLSAQDIAKFPNNAPDVMPL